MRVAVTGAFGFIGSHLVERLLDGGDEVVAIDNMTTGIEENLKGQLGNPRLEIRKLDILDTKDVAAAFTNVKAVVHLAATVSVARSIEEPELVMRNNVKGTQSVLDVSVSKGVKRLVFASSAAVYGRSEPPLREDSRVEPLSPYASSKVAGESYCRAHSESYGLETVVLRLFNVYGPRATSGSYSSVMTKFAEAIRDGRPLTIFGDGRQTRDFVNVEDVVEAMRLCLREGRGSGEVFNIGTGRATSVNSLARIFLKNVGVSSKALYAAERPAEVKHSWADVTKARRVLGYEPRVDLEEGVGCYLSWFLKR